MRVRVIKYDVMSDVLCGLGLREERGTAKGSRGASWFPDHPCRNSMRSRCLPVVLPVLGGVGHKSSYARVSAVLEHSPAALIPGIFPQLAVGTKILVTVEIEEHIYGIIQQ